MLRPLLRVLVAVLVVGLAYSGVVIYTDRADARCRSHEVAVAAQTHTDREPVAEELEPLGQVLEVHWTQQIGGGLCDFSPGSLWYDRVGVARIDPVAAVRLGDRHQWDMRTIYFGFKSDTRLPAWVPTNPDWHRSPSLDATFKPRGAFGSASYSVDPGSGVVYFSSEVDYGASEGLRPLIGSPTP
jgi:hypothetical protein